MSVELYDADYFSSIRGAKSGDRLFLGFLELMRANGAESDEVLDLGCGCGQLLELLVAETDWKISGLDFSPSAIEVARESVGEKVDLVCGSATDRTLYPENKFDLICMMDVVEHLQPENLRMSLANARYWLKPGGRLLIHTFPTLTLHNIYRQFLRWTGKKKALDELDQIHCNVQTRAKLSAILASVDLSCDKMWLQNDFTLTSSTFQKLPAGRIKSLLGFFLDRVLGSSLLRELFSRLGILELASPSIYALASKSDR